MSVKLCNSVVVLAHVFGTLALTSVADAQWTVTNLHPADATMSRANAASGGQQVGYVRVGGVFRASLWRGTAASWVDLNPLGSTDSRGYAAGDGQQGGSAVVGGVERASLWSGTPESWVDLHPTGSSYSRVRGIDGGQQVGVAGLLVVGLITPRASLWTGTANSWVSLHPTSLPQTSFAHGVSGGQQVGFIRIGGGGGLPRAIIWSGTSASWFNLDPPGSSASTYSEALGISDGQQAGYAYVSGVQRASVWSGTTTSRVDLHPAGATSSKSHAVSRGRQVGTANVGNIGRASLWSGTAASWVDLHALLPPVFSTSYAVGISDDGITLYIVGGGFNTLTNREEALLWTRPLASTTGCNPADIACDNGTPLPRSPGCTNSNLGPNEGDYNAFFAADGFFFQAGEGAASIGGTCDIACDNGTPLSQAPGCTNNGVNEGDYNCFFNSLFLSCI